MAELRTVVLVGHCGPDMHMMKTAVGRLVTGATIVAADDDESLRRHLHPQVLLLINRVLEGSFADDRGIELIRRIAREASPPAMMLISDLDQAQAAAVEAGAVRGFGKGQLYLNHTAAALRAAIMT